MNDSSVWKVHCLPKVLRVIAYTMMSVSSREYERLNAVRGKDERVLTRSASPSLVAVYHGLKFQNSF